MKPRRIAALGKQIPRCAVRQRGPNGRLQRDGVALSMNPVWSKNCNALLRLHMEEHTQLRGAET